MPCKDPERARRAREQGDFAEYVFLHERPHRVGALWDVADDIPGDDTYWQLVRDVWMDSEGSSNAGEEWEQLLTGREGQERLMTESERQAVAAMSAVVKVFRGFDRDGGESGFSWTLDRCQAEWFARRYSMLDGHSARVAIGQIRRIAIIAFLDGRDEAEVIAHPHTVSLLSIEDLEGGT